MKRLIVVADDFGLTPGVVAGIVEAHERGIVTATSLMVNAPAAEEAFAWAREHDSLAIGLHFVLTFGKPIGPAAPLGELVARDGTFRRLDTGAHEIAKPEQVRAELDAQLERFEKSIGRPPTHIDGHHHVHALPGILTAVVEAATRHGLAVRSPDESTRQRLRMFGIRTPDIFIDSFYGDGNVHEERLLSILAALPDGTSELMCHPAREDAVLSTLSGYVAPRHKELETLVAPRVRRALEERAVDLVGSVIS